MSGTEVELGHLQDLLNTLPVEQNGATGLGIEWVPYRGRRRFVIGGWMNPGDPTSGNCRAVLGREGGEDMNKAGIACHSPAVGGDPAAKSEKSGCRTFNLVPRRAKLPVSLTFAALPPEHRKVRP